ncbi:hypothetical protein PMZ80_004047 [Knufia obscura]|uniref:Major facilitator superfamily (MFS) profile domain-containing protein n=1 Tax=Knufia obscura TaxID=1635080 RepID=A0ABR0RRM8_9EURO|nr:hypothetical protein PMZ80_004047 [Knufia obscura]
MPFTQVSTERQPLLSPDDGTQAPSPSSDDRASSRRDNDHNDVQHDDISLTRDHFQVLAIMLCFFLTGVHVTAIGTFLPTLERFYNINDSTAALIFSAGVAGYITTCLLMPKVVSLTGWRGVSLIAPMLYLASDILLSIGPAYPVVLASYFVGGLGYGLSDSGFCSWASKRSYANVVQGLMHGSFAVGSIVGPLASYAVLKHGFEWAAFYRMMAILIFVKLVILGLAFWKESPRAFRTTRNGQQQSKVAGLTQAKLILICSIFYFFYIAVEAIYTDWVITYMQRVRDVKLATASLSSSVFWIGMALGRTLLGLVTEYFGLKVSVTAYITLSICLQVAFRLVQNVPTSLVLLGTIGFFLGPMFPSGILLLSSTLPLQQVLGAISAASAVGQVGGGLAPLLLGLMADTLGMKHLPDVVVGLTLLLLVFWLIFARCA